MRVQQGVDSGLQGAYRGRGKAKGLGRGMWRGRRGGGQGASPEEVLLGGAPLCSARSLSLSWSLNTPQRVCQGPSTTLGWLPEPWTSWSYTMDPFPKAEVVAKQKPLPPHPSRCTPPRNLSSELTRFP